MSAKSWGLMMKKARDLNKSLGLVCAAGYLRNRQVPLNDALVCLGFPVRFKE